jgi:hypothetical protein
MTSQVHEEEGRAICSAKGCHAAATWAVVWNNPKVHTPDREKVWAACDEHKQPWLTSSPFDHSSNGSSLSPTARLGSGRRPT